MKFKDYFIIWLSTALTVVVFFGVLKIPGNAFTGILSLILPGSIYIISAISKETKEEHCGKYDSISKTLYLYERCQFIEKRILIRRYKRVNATYVPAEIVYTGATVGGVTTGGFHVNEAHYETQSYNTDKFNLCYKSEDNPINIIVYEKGLGNSHLIEKFKIDDKTLELSYKDTSKGMSSTESNVYMNSIKTGDLGMQYHVLSNVLEKSKIEYDDCLKIKSWIGGQDYK